MFPGFADLELPALARVLRRTIISTLLVGAVGILLALLLSAPFAALGIGIGVAVAIVNLRFLDSGVSKVETRGETNKKVVRRILGTRTATRLAIITGIAIGLLLLNGPPRHRHRDRTRDLPDPLRRSTWPGSSSPRA